MRGPAGHHVPTGSRRWLLWIDSALAAAVVPFALFFRMTPREPRRIDLWRAQEHELRESVIALYFLLIGIAWLAAAIAQQRSARPRLVLQLLPVAVMAGMPAYFAWWWPW